MRSPRRGFTLFELMIAIAIIAILASLTAPALFRNVTDAKLAAARAELSTIAMALESYALTVGDYPSTTEGLAALVGAPRGKENQWRGPYLKGDVPQDPWGFAYRYRYPTPSVLNTYELLSTGKDGKEGGTKDDADITAWEKPK